MGAFSIWHMLVLLAIVALVFGTKRLRNIGEDVGSAIKSFRKGMQDGDGDAQPQLKADPPPTTQSTSDNQSERVG